MAATSRALSATDLAYRAAKKPAIVAANVAEVGSIANLVTNVIGTIAGGDQSAASFDRKYLIDRFRHTAWKGNAAATDWYLNIDRGAGPTQYFDCAIFDQPTFPAGTTVTVKADDVNTPSAAYAGASTIFNAVPVVQSSPSRTNLVATFDAALEWNPRFIQVILHNAAPFTPQLGQLWLGHTVQFPVKSDYGSQDAGAESGDAVRVELGNGVSVDFSLRGALVDRQQVFTIADAPSGTFLVAMKDVFENALVGGVKAYFYFEDVTTGASSAVFTKNKPNARVFDPKQSAAFLAQFKIDFREMGGV